MSGIFPRYNESRQSDYTSMQEIKTHQPYLLEEKDNMQIEEFKGLTTQQQISRKLFAPNLQLIGHQAEVYTLKFSPDGNLLASAGADKSIFLWDVFNNCSNVHVFKGHKNAVLDLHWSPDGTKIYTASADKSVTVWDVESMKRLKKMTGHTSFVNACHPARRGLELVISGSDDKTIKIWDLRVKTYVDSLDYKYQITSVSFNDTTEKAVSGSLDNQVKQWDLRKRDIENSLIGHTDTITSLSLSFDGSYILSNSMDQTIRCWDIRPFVVGNRCVKIFQGATHDYEKNLLKVNWSTDGSMITSGSANRYQYIWDTTSRKILLKYAGHNGSVNEACFSPKDHIVASCSSDKTLLVSELPDKSLMV